MSKVSLYVSAVEAADYGKLKSFEDDFDEFPDDGIVVAVRRHDEQMVEYLLGRGVVEYWRPMFEAVAIGDVNLAELLLDKFIAQETGFKFTKREMISKLSRHVIREGNLYVTMFMVSKNIGIDLDAADSYVRDTEHEIMNIVAFLLQNKYDINGLLRMVARCGCPIAVGHLASLGATSFADAAKEAAALDHVAVAARCIRQHEDVDIQNVGDVVEYFGGDWSTLIKWPIKHNLLAVYDVMKPRSSANLVNIAIENGNTKLAAELVDEYSDTNYLLAMYDAATLGSISLLKILSKKCELSDQEKMTVVEGAVLHRQNDVCDFLIELWELEPSDVVDIALHFNVLSVANSIKDQ